MNPGHGPGRRDADGTEARAARDRHPAARGSARPLRRSVERSVDRLPGIDGPHRSVAAAVAAIRGGEHRTRAAFAAAYGLTEGEVAAIEAGRVAVRDVPAPLRVLTPLPGLAG